MCEGERELGDSCQNPFQCGADTFCISTSCSECRDDTDCSGACAQPNFGGPRYHHCVKSLGEACTYDEECGSGMCHDNGCGECRVDMD